MPQNGHVLGDSEYLSVACKGVVASVVLSVRRASLSADEVKSNVGFSTCVVRLELWRVCSQKGFIIRKRM